MSAITFERRHHRVAAAALLALWLVAVQHGHALPTAQEPHHPGASIAKSESSTSATATPIATTTAEPTGNGTSFYVKAVNTLERFGHSLQQTGATVAESVSNGYNYSVQKIRETLGSGGAAKTPLQTIHGDSGVTTTASHAASNNTNNKTTAARGGSDSIVFRYDDGDDDGAAAATGAAVVAVVAADHKNSLNAAPAPTAKTMATAPTAVPKSVAETTLDADDNVSIDDRIIIDVPLGCGVGEKRADDGKCRKIVT